MIFATRVGWLPHVFCYPLERKAGALNAEATEHGDAQGIDRRSGPTLSHERRRVKKGSQAAGGEGRSTRRYGRAFQSAPLPTGKTSSRGSSRLTLSSIVAVWPKGRSCTVWCSPMSPRGGRNASPSRRGNRFW